MSRVHLSSSLLTWLRTFEAVVRCRSFTRAAQDLSITQGAVSQQVRQLEAWAGKPLLMRSARSLAPNAEGERLATVLSTSLQAIEQVLAQIRTPDVPDKLLLSCSPTFAMSWLTPRLGDFYRRLPEVGLQVLAEFHPLDARRMQTEGLGAALRYDLGHYPDLQAQPVLDEVLLPVASPGFMAEHPGLRSPADLDAASLLHDESPWPGARPGEEWLHWLGCAGAPMGPERLQQGRVFNLSMLAVGAALAHQGVAMGRLSMVLDDLLTGRLVLPFPAYAPSRAAYHLVTGTHPPAAVALVGAWLTEQAAAFKLRRDAYLAALVRLD